VSSIDCDLRAAFVWKFDVVVGGTSLLQAAGPSQLHYESTPRRRRGNLPLFAGSAEKRSASAGG
jgi:hypothetical protein